MSISKQREKKTSGTQGKVISDQEDTKNVLTNFISRQLGIKNPEGIEFQRVHRIGKKGDRPRMVIARFLRYADRKNYEEPLQTEEHRFHDLW